jgi:hypothetical protein
VYRKYKHPIFTIPPSKEQELATSSGMPITRRFFRGLNDRLVPEAEVNPGILNVSYWEI